MYAPVILRACDFLHLQLCCFIQTFLSPSVILSAAPEPCLSQQSSKARSEEPRECFLCHAVSGSSHETFSLKLSELGRGRDDLSPRFSGRLNRSLQKSHSLRAKSKEL